MIDLSMLVLACPVESPRLRVAAVSSRKFLERRLIPASSDESDSTVKSAVFEIAALIFLTSARRFPGIRPLSVYANQC